MTDAEKRVIDAAVDYEKVRAREYDKYSHWLELDTPIGRLTDAVRRLEVDRAKLCGTERVSPEAIEAWLAAGDKEHTALKYPRAGRLPK